MDELDLKLPLPEFDLGDLEGIDSKTNETDEKCWDWDETIALSFLPIDVSDGKVGEAEAEAESKSTPTMERKYHFLASREIKKKPKETIVLQRLSLVCVQKKFNLDNPLS